MPELITLYSAKVCPWAHRVELALKESGLEYDRYEIDLGNKPVWYAPKVNPASKVPAIAYGGPKVPADQPSPESTKIAESYTLIEFVADLQPSLLPKDPVGRAKARFFVEQVAAQVFPTYFGFLMRGEAPEGYLKGIEILQKLLPAEGYAVGEWSIADAAITPHLARAEVVLKNDLGPYEAGLGKKTYEALSTDPKFERYRKYFADVTSRDSFKQTFFEDYLTGFYAKRWARPEAKA